MGRGLHPTIDHDLVWNVRHAGFAAAQLAAGARMKYRQVVGHSLPQQALSRALGQQCRCRRLFEQILD